MDKLYDINVNDITGQSKNLTAYKDRVLLILNVASKCGFTKQYEALEELYKRYKDKGFSILAFPCNQFGQQETGSSEEILEFCQLTYGVSFEVFEKIEVNGKNAHPLFNYLKEEAPGILNTQKIKWNFTKFLVDKKGEKIKRFAPNTNPKDIEDEIKTLLD